MSNRKAASRQNNWPKCVLRYARSLGNRSAPQSRPRQAEPPVLPLSHRGSRPNEFFNMSGK
jgi:hypothetical protein